MVDGKVGRTKLKLYSTATLYGTGGANTTGLFMVRRRHQNAAVLLTSIIGGKRGIIMRALEMSAR